MDVNPEQIWLAVTECDPAYDGNVYYAVNTTGIFCRPSCRSKTPKREHVEFFWSPQAAVRNGYRACKRCRPDLLEAYDPKDQAVNAIKTILNTEYQKPWTLHKLSKRVGFSAYHLQRLFKEKAGLSPKQYLTHIRIQRAKTLLLEGEHSNLDICFTVGFNQPEQFYNAFRKTTGCSPLSYRKGKM